MSLSACSPRQLGCPASKSHMADTLQVLVRLGWLHELYFLSAAADGIRGMKENKVPLLAVELLVHDGMGGVVADLEGDLVDLADLEGDLEGVLVMVAGVPADGALVDLGDLDDLDDLSEHLLLLLLLLADGALDGLLVPADGDLVDLLRRFRALLLPLPADGALLDLEAQVGDVVTARAWRTSPHLVRS